MVRLTLTELRPDLQIHICEFLHPLHILALRQTCKTFHEITSQLIVWVGALNRMCHHHSLFLPSFRNIPDMSVSKLERAATAPSRWNMLSSRSADKVLSGRTTQITNNSILSTVDDPQLQVPEDLKIEALEKLYLVPGGRYLVASSPTCLGVWDLGYVSDGAMSSDEKFTRVWATTVSTVNEFLVEFTVCPTPDGLGIRILTSSFIARACSVCLRVFEIYPQRKTHEHAKIGEFTFNITESYDISLLLCGNRAITYSPSDGAVMVWDFMANTVANWSLGLPQNYEYQSAIVGGTETTLCIFYDGVNDRNTYTLMIRIFEIPSRIPAFDDFPEVALAPIFEFKDSKVFPTTAQGPDFWHFGRGDPNPRPFYLNVHHGERYRSLVGRYTVDITSDLSDLSLESILNLGFIPQALDPIPISYHILGGPYRICEDSSVHVVSTDRGIAAITVGFKSSKCHDSSQSATAQVYLVEDRFFINSPKDFCPVSGRLVYVKDSAIVISDFL